MNNKFMQEAIKIAQKTSKDIPVGAVIVKDEKIISTGYNTKEQDCDITAHAEIIAIKVAEKKLNNWRLENCDIYVTLEPCPMCGWAILQARFRNVYFGSFDRKYGTFTNAKLDKLSDYKPNIYGGILEEECDKLLKDFFKNLRA